MAVSLRVKGVELTGEGIVNVLDYAELVRRAQPGGSYVAARWSFYEESEYKVE